MHGGPERKQEGVASGVPIRPCEGCGYNLTGLADQDSLVCPECGLKQMAPEALLAWPRWTDMGVRTGASTLGLCTLVFLFVVFQRFIPLPVAVLVVVSTMGSVIAAPFLVVVRMGFRRDMSEGKKYIFLGWLWNLLIVAAFMGLLAIWPGEWTFRDTFWDEF